MTALSALLLAGGSRDDVCRDDPAAVNKAFVAVGGSPLVTRVLRALREANSIGHIRVVAPPDAPAGPLMLADERLPAGIRIGDSLREGLATFPPDELVLVAASDLPLISAVGVDDFAVRALSSKADLCYGYLERLAHEARYPTIPHTWARLRDGVYCGAGLCAIRPRALQALLGVLEELAAARKAPWRLATVFGFGTFLRYVTGLLRIEEAESRATHLLSATARGILTTHAELAVNIDRYDDLQRVEALLKPPLDAGSQSPTR